MRNTLIKFRGALYNRVLFDNNYLKQIAPTKDEIKLLEKNGINCEVCKPKPKPPKPPKVEPKAEQLPKVEPKK